MILVDCVWKSKRAKTRVNLTRWVIRTGYGFTHLIDRSIYLISHRWSEYIRQHSDAAWRGSASDTPGSPPRYPDPHVQSGYRPRVNHHHSVSLTWPEMDSKSSIFSLSRLPERLVKLLL